MTRAKLDRASAYRRHPLQPHQLVDRVTQTEDTIVLCHLGVPRIDTENWSLAIDGLVRRPMRLTWNDLVQHPRVYVISIHVSRVVAAAEVEPGYASGVRDADLFRDPPAQGLL